EASRNPDVFSSGKGATSIADLPVEFNEYFGSMINMDDPRHARLRRIVSRAFTPRMIQRFADDVAGIAAGIVDDLLDTEPCDLEEHVAGRLRLTFSCQLTGIRDDRYAAVLGNPKIILPAMAPHLACEEADDGGDQSPAAGGDRGAVGPTLAQQSAPRPADGLI